MTNVTEILKEMDDLAALIGRGNNLSKGTVVMWELKFKSLIVRLRTELGLDEKVVASVGAPNETTVVNSP